MRPDERRALEACSLFRGLADDERDAIVGLAEVLSFERQEQLFRQGEPVDGLYVLLSGRVKLSQLGPEGQEVIIRLLGPGELFAGLAALDRATSFPVGAQASTEARAAFWRRPVIREVFREHRTLAANLLQEISVRAREFQSRLREVATERVPQRVARMLLRLAAQGGRPIEGGVLIDFPLTRQDLAEMTGTTLYTVSRLLSAWADRRLVEVGRGRVVVLDPRALEAVADESEGG